MVKSGDAEPENKESPLYFLSGSLEDDDGPDIDMRPLTNFSVAALLSLMLLLC